MSSFLRYLTEDPKQEVAVSLLSIFLYEYCQESGQQTDTWANLFIPGIQADSYLVAALRALGTHISRAFPQWIDQLWKGTQARFIAALAATMNRLSEKLFAWPRLVLTKFQMYL
jgi:hypothetical protein